MPDHAPPAGKVVPVTRILAEYAAAASPETLPAPVRKEAARTVDTLWSAIGRLVDLITPAECVNMFAAAGYDPD